MNTTHDDSNSERITLHSNEGIRRPEPEDEPESPHNDEREEEEEEPMEQQQRAPLLRRSYSQESGISTDSAPPPYEVYPPAKTFLGRAYNWLRQIPRIRRHQAIALPTLPLHRSHRSHDSLSSTSIDSFASSAYPATCCSYYYYSLVSYLPTCPRFILPHRLARCRGILICISFFALFIFAFLLFCSIFFSPASLSPSGLPDLVTDTSARFLTLNIFMRPPGVTNNWSDYKDDRLDYIVRYILPQYDVVAFQEAFAFGTRRKDDLIQRAQNMGYNHHVESPRHYPWDFGVDGGLLILSRFPIRASHTIEYPRGIHSDWLSYKGALHALIELNPTHSIHVYTTHSQASYTGMNSQSQADTQVRMSQFSQLHQFISETAQRDNVPILLLGDFNVDAAVHGPGRPITEPSKENSQEYDMMMDVLRGNGVDPVLLRGKRQRKRVYADTWHLDELTDVVYEHYKYHPVTFGDVMLNGNGQLEPAETVLTDMDEAMTVQSIDRILWDKARASSLTIRDAQVEKFLVRSNDLMSEHDKQQTPFTQVSDHYGLSCVVQLV